MGFIAIAKPVFNRQAIPIFLFFLLPPLSSIPIFSPIFFPIFPLPSFKLLYHFPFLPLSPSPQSSFLPLSPSTSLSLPIPYPSISTLSSITPPLPLPFLQPVPSLPFPYQSISFSPPSFSLCTRLSASFSSISPTSPHFISFLLFPLSSPPISPSSPPSLVPLPAHPTYPPHYPPSRYLTLPRTPPQIPISYPIIPGKQKPFPA